MLDASATVELLLSTASGRAVATHLTADETLHAPELLGPEVLSVVRRLVRSGTLSEPEGSRVLGGLNDLSVETYEHMPLLGRAFELRDTLTAYDACYIALAEALGSPLLTTDAKLAGAHGHGAEVRLVTTSR